MYTGHGGWLISSRVRSNLPAKACSDEHSTFMHRVGS